MSKASDDDGGAIIIELPNARERPLLSSVRRNVGRRCIAHTFHINEDDHSVRCSQCGCVFEPFDALIQITRRWDRYNQQIIAYDREIERLKKVEADLKREVANLKAQRRRHADPSVQSALPDRQKR